MTTLTQLLAFVEHAPPPVPSRQPDLIGWAIADALVCDACMGRAFARGCNPKGSPVWRDPATRVEWKCGCCGNWVKEGGAA